jgi:gluconolactonase
MPPHLETFDPRFASLVLHHAPLERLATGFRWTEGPVWFADMQTLLFSDIPNDRVMRWTEDGGVSVARAPSGFANGHARDPQGRLLTCSHGLRAVTRTGVDGSVTILADRFDGKRLNSPNDIAVRSDGTIWFTDPTYGIAFDYEGERRPQELPCRVYRLDPGTGALDIVADDFAGPNGIAFSPDERTLYVSDTGAPFDPDARMHIRAFAVEAGGIVTGGAILHAVAPGVADGFRCDEHGNVWTSAADGVHCVAPNGTLIGKILVPETVANLAFGGLHRSRLFICASSSLYAIHLACRGAARP